MSRRGRTRPHRLRRGHGVGEGNVMGTTSNDWRAGLVGWSLRGAGAALGLWFVALLTATVASAQTADLAVTQSSTPNPAMAGGVVNVTITVTNNGPSAASDVAMVDLFPPDNFAILPVGAPAGWTCTPGTNLLECTIPTLAAGASATFLPSFRSSAETPSGAVLVNDAIITSTTVDPNPANNLASM